MLASDVSQIFCFEIRSSLTLSQLQVLQAKDWKDENWASAAL